ncbi:MAG TPA: TonB family protein [Mucilaginibacter sp.]
MLISKFDLCKSEWLELVFAKRNKEYGAYYLRQHYAENINKAMGITFIGVTGLVLTLSIVTKAKPVELVKNTIVELNKYVAPPVTPPKEEIHQAKASAPKAIVNTTKFLVPVVTNAPVKEDPPKTVDIKGEVGPADIDVAGISTAAGVDEGKGNSTTINTKAEEDNIVHTTAGVDVMPEPYGGAAAWAKFLQKNLRYPSEAMDKDVSGKVWVSFIIEKNGHLSSLVVEKGAGYGMDEEAMRVLKLAPPWKPGMQNGQPVRVKYTLPLNFVLNQ